MKRRKSVPTARSFFSLSAAGRVATSITENTIAPLMERLGKTVARKPLPAAAKVVWRQRQGMSLDEMKARDEQAMFDAQMMSLLNHSSPTHRQADQEARVDDERTRREGRNGEGST